MSGVKVSGLVSGLNTQQIINELIAADSVGVNAVQAQQATTNSQVTALGALSTAMTTIENDVFDLEDPSLYDQVSGSSSTANSTWQISPQVGTSPGSYTVAVSQLATASTMTGSAGISLPLSASMDVSGVTLATMPTATPVTAGVFSVNGQQVTVTTAESLADVFSAIATATGGAVAASYDSGSDKVTLASSSGSLVLGAANDTSNFLSALELGNTGGPSSTSTGPLGTVNTTSALGSADLSTPLTGLDSSGNGAFTINGVSIGYNAGSDSLTAVINRINASGAGVAASYDATDNRMIVTNGTTGDTGMSMSDTSGNLLAALGLAGSGASLAFGNNAEFTVNGGPLKSSSSNTLSAASLGVTGLNVTVTTADTQTIQVANNSTNLLSTMQSFITDFNALQTDISTDTKITTGNGTVATSLLSGMNEVGDWATEMEDKVFSAGSASGGSITSLDAMGIDFSGTSGMLEVSDSGALSAAVTGNPAGVEAFFSTAKTGFGSIVNDALNDIEEQSSAEQASLQSESADLGNQITVMQSQLAAETATLNAEFTAMEAAEAQMDSESSVLNGLSGTSGTSSGASTLSSTTPSVSPTNGTSTTASSATGSGSGSTSSTA